MSSTPSSSAVFRHLVGFFLCAGLFSWLLWLPLALGEPGQTGTSPRAILHLVGSLGPALSGLYWAWLTGGREGLRRLVRRIAFWRIGWGWQMAVWLGPFALLVIAQLVARANGAEVTPGELAPSAEYPAMPVAIYWVAVLFFYGFGEEIGWRGFALPMLQERFSPFMATLGVAAIWAVWHWPLFFFSPGLSALGAGGIAGWAASLLTGAFLLTVILNGTGGSVFAAAVFHATMDIAFLGPSEVMMVVGALTTLLGLGALAWTLTRGRAGNVTLLTRD
ncbi:CPBP family intramembrane metalloprotease [Ciceribacter sp. L1K23]|uniref:CPBP family intramembrane glutamic endopeptidase n=1 Tax=Ciceribacter sp. L1K23 TaxID=2820276 RepID=UPI001B816725|nr:type II CAAX endopeptidase family protein [Ciceribacter sp. L1K23]MBR0555131.1 CPBP family intramembrane metalloprotease [Ciceribacter sp. L1K23]